MENSITIAAADVYARAFAAAFPVYAQSLPGMALTAAKAAGRSAMADFLESAPPSAARQTIKTLEAQDPGDLVY